MRRLHPLGCTGARIYSVPLTYTHLITQRRHGRGTHPDVHPRITHIVIALWSIGSRCSNWVDSWVVRSAPAYRAISLRRRVRSFTTQSWKQAVALRAFPWHRCCSCARDGGFCGFQDRRKAGLDLPSLHSVRAGCGRRGHGVRLATMVGEAQSTIFQATAKLEDVSFVGSAVGGGGGVSAATRAKESQIPWFSGQACRRRIYVDFKSVRTSGVGGTGGDAGRELTEAPGTPGRHQRVKDEGITRALHGQALGAAFEEQDDEYVSRQWARSFSRPRTTQ